MSTATPSSPSRPTTTTAYPPLRFGRHSSRSAAPRTARTTSSDARLLRRTLTAAENERIQKRILRQKRAAFVTLFLFLALSVGAHLLAREEGAEEAQHREGEAPGAMTSDEAVDEGREGCEAVPDAELLTAWFCPYAQRVRIALEEKCPGKFVATEALRSTPGGFEKDARLFEKNPRGAVPVILDRRGVGGENGEEGEGEGNGEGEGEAIVYESLICVEYVDEAFGDGTASLLPGPPAKRARARMWADKLNGEYCGEFYKLLMSQSEEGQRKAAEKMLKCLREFGERCVGPYFLGEEFGIVDVALAPWAVGTRMRALEHYRPSFRVPRTEEYAKFHEWSAAVARRPSFVASEGEDFDALVEVYRPYAAGSPPKVTICDRDCEKLAAGGRSKRGRGEEDAAGGKRLRRVSSLADDTARGEEAVLGSSGGGGGAGGGDDDVGRRKIPWPMNREPFADPDQSQHPFRQVPLLLLSLDHKPKIDCDCIRSSYDRVRNTVSKSRS
ncbi:hypothetical protein ACHAWF_016829 [Thalassiosira exigua]